MIIKNKISDNGKDKLNAALAKYIKDKACQGAPFTSIALADWIDIGVLGNGDKELYLQKHKISENSGKIETTVAEEPVKAAIDPYNKHIDRNPGDNVKKVECVVFWKSIFLPI